MSLWDPVNPKNVCHIQRSYDATISKIIVGSRVWPIYWPFHLLGQFFHFQCMQSMLPSILRNPRCWPTANNFAMSLSFGDLMYSLEKIKTTALTKNFKPFIAVLSPILKYSSMKLADTPYISKHSDCGDHLLKGRQLECVSCISFLNKVWFSSFNS